MDATGFKDIEIIRILNNNYYAIKLNAETKITLKIGSFATTYLITSTKLRLFAGRMNGNIKK